MDSDGEVKLCSLGSGVAKSLLPRMLLSLVTALESALSPEDPSSDEEIKSLFIDVRNEYHALIKCLCDIANPGLELDTDFLPLMRIVATVPRIAHAKAVAFVRILRDMDLAIREELASVTNETNSEPRYMLKRYDYVRNPFSGTHTSCRHIRLVADHLVKLSQEAGHFRSRQNFDLSAVSDSSLGRYLGNSGSGDELSPEIAGILRMGETLLVCAFQSPCTGYKTEAFYRVLKEPWSSADGFPMPVSKTMKSTEPVSIGSMVRWRNDLIV